MANYPVGSIINLPRKQIIYYVSPNEYYVCTADSPNRNRTDYKWQIMRVTNSNSGNYPYEQIIVFPNGDDTYTFRQSDFLTLTYPDN